MSNYSYDNTKYIGSIDYKIGQEIESCRLVQGYTQKDLAKKMVALEQQKQGREQKHTDSINYKIGQKIKHWRLIQKYTQEDLANKIGVPKQQILKYEQGVGDIYPRELYAIAKALSVNIENLLPRQKVLRENHCFDKGRVQGKHNLIEKYAKIRGQKLRKTILELTKSIQAEEKSNVKTVRIEIAKNLLQAGFSVDVIYRATGLSTNEYNNTEKEICTDSADCTIGQRIKYWRLKRGYTQADLASKVGVSQQQIQKYERGINLPRIDRLDAIAKALLVGVEVLLKPAEKDCYENEYSGTEKELSSLIGEYEKVNNQESRDALDALVEFLSKSMQTYKEKVNKAERIQVTNNLLRLGISIDVISQVTGLSTDEIA